MIVSFNDRTTSIETIPLPAITVCTTEKATKENVDLDRLSNAMRYLNYANKLPFMNLTANEFSLFDTSIY